MRVKKSRPTARTNGAAKGSSMIASGSSLASARAAATIVAVAPTLEARSQLSPGDRGESARVMVFLLEEPRWIFSKCNELAETLPASAGSSGGPERTSRYQLLVSYTV